MGTLDWGNGSSAASRTSFLRRVRSVACCRTEHDRFDRMRERTMPSGEVTRLIGAVIEQGKQEDLTSLAAVMVHVDDIEHDSERRVELAIDLADRFQAALIGVAGCALWPAFMAGNAGLTKSNQYDFQKLMTRFEQKGKTFHAQGRSLKQIEWRSALESPGELLLREARAAGSPRHRSQA